MKVSCIILAGGNPSRIKDKPFALIDGKPMITYGLGVARKLFSDIIVVVKNERQKRKLRKIVSKKIKIVKSNSRFYSPIAEIREGIKKSKYDYIFVLSSDMPLVNEHTIRELLPRVPEGLDCIAYIWKLKKYEPLCAIYRKYVFYNRKLKSRMCSLIQIIENKAFVPIAMETDEFFSVRTKKDLKFVENQLKIMNKMANPAE